MRYGRVILSTYSLIGIPVTELQGTFRLINCIEVSDIPYKRGQSGILDRGRHRIENLI